MFPESKTFTHPPPPKKRNIYNIWMLKLHIYIVYVYQILHKILVELWWGSNTNKCILSEILHQVYLKLFSHLWSNRPLDTFRYHCGYVPLCEQVTKNKAPILILSASWEFGQKFTYLSAATCVKMSKTGIYLARCCCISTWSRRSTIPVLLFWGPCQCKIYAAFTNFDCKSLNSWASYHVKYKLSVSLSTLRVLSSEKILCWRHYFKH